MQEILRANQIAHPEFILPGQQLVVPEPTEVGDDWPMLGRTPSRAGAGPAALEGTPLPGWTCVPRKNLGVRPSAPVIRYERVFVGLGDSHYYSIDRGSGRVKWRIPAGSAQGAAAIAGHALAAPAVYEGLVYLCGPDGVTSSVDAYTGHLVWKVPGGGPITSSPAIAGGLLYFGSWDHHVYALEAKTGAVAWKSDVGAPVFRPVAVGDDHVYTVTEQAELWALDAQTGDVIWKGQAGQRETPVFAEVLVVVGGTAFDPANGQPLWTVEAGAGSPVIRADQVIYPGGAVELFTGSVRWARSGVSGPSSSNRTPAPGTPIQHHIATGTWLVGIGTDTRLHALDADDGATVWTIDLDGQSSQPPAAAPGQIVVALDDGSLRSYRLKPDR